MIPDIFPPEWTDDALREHVADIMFNGAESLDPDCILCQEAAHGGHFDRFDDGDPWLEDLKRRAADRRAPTP
jgi:hypothetical protein